MATRADATSRLAGDAAMGARRVLDILAPDGRRIMTPDEVSAAHPSLARR